MLTRDSLETGNKFDFSLELPIGDVEPFRVTVTYLDERLLSGSKDFIVSAANSTFQIVEEA